MKNNADGEPKASSSAKLLMLIVTSMLILIGAVYFVMLGRGDTEKSSDNRITDSASSDNGMQSPGYEEAPGEIATDPVSGEQVFISKAPYQYYFAGNIYYFKSEKNLLAFIDDPIRYSGAKLKLTVKVKTSPVPDEVMPPADNFPDNTETPGNSTPDATISDTPVDTPTEAPEGIVETPFGADEPSDVPNSDKVEKPAEEHALPPADLTKPEDPPPAAVPEGVSPTKPADEDKGKYDIPSGAYSTRPKPSPAKKPELKETPIAPPTEGVETL